MTRFAVVVAIWSLLCALPGLAQAGAAAAPLQVRFSASAATVRVVLDLPAEVAVTDQSTPTAAAVSLALPLDKPLPAVTVTDPIVTGITVAPDANGQAMLTVALAKARKCRVFTLPAEKGKPFRLVVDVLKLFSHEEHRTLSPAIRYTRLERQTDDRYFVAHLVSVQAKDTQVRLRVAAAQGERETVAAMVTRTQAVCGINAGYFLARTRPAGLLKVEDRYHSLPLWGRTALAIPQQGMPIFGNPTGRWLVTLPGGVVRELPDWLDASVLEPAPAARVISGGSFTQAPANPNGVTAIIRAGMVLARPKEATPLEVGDFALHLTGEDAKALDPVLAVGMPVQVLPAITAEWMKYPYAVGAGPRLLAEGTVRITGSEERFKPDVLNGRPARSAIGATRDGRVLLVIVEAPGPYGGGATLEELAALLKAFGAREAMNLDGGGSATLAIGVTTVNYPPPAWVRPVASGILVYDDRVDTGRPQ